VKSVERIKYDFKKQKLVSITEAREGKENKKE